jgi:hypothetical protein
MAVICALHRLMKESDLYKNSGITIDEKWIEELDEEHINENYDLRCKAHITAIFTEITTFVG